MKTDKTTSENNNDRRQFTRVNFRHEMEIRDGQGQLYKGAFNDISLKGMLFFCEKMPPEGAVITGIMPLGEEKMTIVGRVLRSSHERGVAIRFENMDVESFSHLRRLVSLNMGDAERIDAEFFGSL